MTREIKDEYGLEIPDKNKYPLAYSMYEISRISMEMLKKEQDLLYMQNIKLLFIPEMCGFRRNKNYWDHKDSSSEMPYLY